MFIFVVHAVTMEWWTHLWLNEGYASFVEFLCVNKLFPEYDIWTQFVADMYTRALELDCLKNSHPIEVPVGHPSEIDEIFDEISYAKGASVIRMLHHYIGDNDFRKGMNVYLTRHQYKNTHTEDLWAALSEASSKPVANVMSTWIKQMGFPVITVSAEQKGQKRILTLTQNKFTADGVDPADEYFWMVPITISTSKAPTEIAVAKILDKKSMEIDVNDVDENDWIKINPGTIGTILFSIVYLFSDPDQYIFHQLSICVSRVFLCVRVSRLLSCSLHIGNVKSIDTSHKKSNVTTIGSFRFN